VQLVELQRAVRVEPPEEGVGDGARLFVDLLAHEPVVAGLLGSGQVPGDLERVGVGGLACEVGDRDRVGRDVDDLVLAKLDGEPRELDEGGDVRGDEILPVPHADDQRGVAARRDEAVRL